jgi:hypothetical protein
MPFATVTKKADSGAVIMRVRHAPIASVTPTMVRWMWNNMNKQVADPRDGKKWQVRSGVCGIPATLLCAALTMLQCCEVA